MDYRIESILPEGVDLQGQADSVYQFVASFEEMCYALGGNDLIGRVRSEVDYEISRGCDMVEALTRAYKHIRGDIQ